MDNSKRNLKSEKQSSQQDYKRAYEFVRCLIKDGQYPSICEISEYCGVSLQCAENARNTYFDVLAGGNMLLAQEIAIDLPF